MTGNELKILQDWMADGFRRVEHRLDQVDDTLADQGTRIEDIQDNQLTPDEREAVKGAVQALRWFRPRNAPIIGVPIIGGIWVLFDWIKGFLS